MTKSLQKICGRTKDRTRDLLNTSRTAPPTDLAGPVCLWVLLLLFSVVLFFLVLSLGVVGMLRSIHVALPHLY